MNISFLCSSYEPGRDGVGDYVAQFCRALTRRGHSCQIVALCDRHIAAPTTSFLEGSTTEVVRVPAARWAAGDLELAANALYRFEPDWTSLQMVCYGYDPRGLLLRSAARFAKLRLGGRRHLMFHELWIGESPDYGIRDRALGWLQKHLLLRTARIWAPAVVHTSNPTYRMLLQHNGVAAKELPLPGNIRIAAPVGRTARDWLIERLCVLPEEASTLWVAGVFGSMHAHWAEFSWVGRLASAVEASGRRLVVLQLGRVGHAGREIWAALRDRFGGSVRCLEWGETSERDLSFTLQGIDLGIATSRWSLVGKSGTVAAMLEHGLPVAVTLTSSRFRQGGMPEPAAHPLLHRFGDALLDRIRSGTLARGRPQPSEHVYDAFVDSLAASNRIEGKAVASAALACPGPR